MIGGDTILVVFAQQDQNQLRSMCAKQHAINIPYRCKALIPDPYQ